MQMQQRSASAAPMIHAVVQTGRTETHYRRAGSGPPVLLLWPEGYERAMETALFAQLGARFRVVAPRIPAWACGGDAGHDAMPLWRWLRDLVDGLGLTLPALVVHEMVGVAALGFPLVDPGRVGDVVAIARDRLDGTEPAAVVADLSAGGAHRLLIMRIGPAGGAAAAETAAGEVVRFLAR